MTWMTELSQTLQKLHLQSLAGGLLLCSTVGMVVLCLNTEEQTQLHPKTLSTCGISQVYPLIIEKNPASEWGVLKLSIWFKDILDARFMFQLHPCPKTRSCFHRLSLSLQSKSTPALFDLIPTGIFPRNI